MAILSIIIWHALILSFIHGLLCLFTRIVREIDLSEAELTFVDGMRWHV